MPPDWDGRLRLQGGTANRRTRSMFRVRSPLEGWYAGAHGRREPRSRDVPGKAARKGPREGRGEAAAFGCRATGVGRGGPAPGRARSSAEPGRQGIWRAERARPDPVWGLGKEGPDVGFLTGGPYNH